MTPNRPGRLTKTTPSPGEGTATKPPTKSSCQEKVGHRVAGVNGTGMSGKGASPEPPPWWASTKTAQVRHSGAGANINPLGRYRGVLGNSHASLARARTLERAGDHEGRRIRALPPLVSKRLNTAGKRQKGGFIHSNLSIDQSCQKAESAADQKRSHMALCRAAKASTVGAPCPKRATT